MMKRPSALFLLISALLNLCNYAHSESLELTAFKILSGSPSYQSSLYSLDSEINRFHTNSNLPDPVIGAEYLVAPEGEPDRWGAELSWEVEWPGIYKARSKEANKRIEAARQALSVQNNERLTEIKSLLIDYINYAQKISILDDLNQNNDTIYQLARIAAKEGEMTVLDINKIRLEYANIKGARSALIIEQASVVSNLSKIYGNDCSTLLNQMDCRFPDVSIPSEEEVRLFCQASPSVASSQYETEIAKNARNVAKMEAFPSLSVGYKHAFEDGIHFNGALLGISIPIFSTRGKMKSAKSEILATEFKAEEIVRSTMAEAIQTRARLALIQQQINELAPLLDNTDYHEALLKAYSGGLITLVDYLSERNYFTNAEMELLNLRYEAAKTWNDLQKISNNFPN